MTAYDSIIEKLDRFIRKYYLNELLKGIIFSGIYIIALFLSVVLLEYYFYLPGLLRKVLFLGFVGSSLLFIARFVVMPILHYNKLGRIISNAQAAVIIGNHFAEVKDKLLNVIQLKAQDSGSDLSLLNAGIEQKTKELRPIQFAQAVDFRENKKYAKYLLPPLMVLLFIIIAAPNIITESSKRLYFSNREFAREAPFKFIIENEALRVQQFESFILLVKTEGNVQPSEMFIRTAGVDLRMKQLRSGSFEYRFDKLREKQDFQLVANGFVSQQYTLEVIPKPILDLLEVVLEYPAYTRKKNETLRNSGDLVVPEGTKIIWKMKAQNANEVAIIVNDSIQRLRLSDDGFYKKNIIARNGFRYVIKTSDTNTGATDSASYSLSVIPDNFPSIQVVEKRDSANPKFFFYLGEVSDDYGVRLLTFNYQIQPEDASEAGVVKSVNVPLPANADYSRFTHFWNMQEMELRAGDKMTYYFEVWDNDGVNGSKSSRSQVLSFVMPSPHETEKQIEQANKDLKKEMDKAVKDADKLQSEMKSAREKMFEKKNLNWDDKKQVTELMDKQKMLEEQIKEMKEKFEKNLEKQNEFKQPSESVKQKQEQLKEMFENLLTQEIKDLYKKLEVMLEKLNKKEAIENLQEMEMTNEQLEKELDRMLELFKKLEFAQKLEETADKLDKMAQKQEELGKQSDQKNADAEKLAAEQNKLNKEMSEAKDDMKQLDKMNQDTDSGAELSDAQQSMEKAEQQMNQAGEQLQKGKPQNAGSKQKDAADKMKQAAQQLRDAKQQMEQDQMAEDYEAIRQLMENIVYLSFAQEKMMGELRNIRPNTPKYGEIQQRQVRLKENSKMVEDSLYALAKRVFQLQSFVTKQINDINRYMVRAQNHLEENNVSVALADQQYIMTGYNNLALMLSESMSDMQQDMSNQNSSGGTPRMCKKNCKNPGKGMPNLSQMQKQLSDKISQLGDMMKKEGDRQGAGKGMSKEFSELAKQQAELRKALEEMNRTENKDGKGSMGDLQKAIEQMEKNETDLVNKQITTEMLKRQQDIMVRLLEAEKAKRERDEKEERESRTGNDNQRKMPPSLEEYLKQKQAEAELYKTVPPTLKPYYRELAEQYFKRISGY